MSNNNNKNSVICPNGHSVPCVGGSGPQSIVCPTCRVVVTVVDGAATKDESSGEGDEFAATVVVDNTPPDFRFHAPSKPRTAGVIRIDNVEMKSRLWRPVALIALPAVAGLVGLAWWLMVRGTHRERGDASPQTVAATTGNSAAGGQSDALRLNERAPRFPNPLRRAPEWLVKDAPFDVKKLFPDSSENEEAVALMIDAFGEFSRDMELYFPQEFRDARRQQLDSRTQRFNAFFERWNRNMKAYLQERKAADDVEVDQILSEYNVGFEKLAVAQSKRPLIFETSVGLATLLPHAQVARTVAFLLEVQAFRAITRHDPNTAIASLKSALRMSRDLRPRGAAVCQLVSIAIDRICLNSILPAILDGEDCTAEHCDTLASLLREHQATGWDRWEAGAQAEYLMLRTAIHDLEHRTGDFAPDRIPKLMEGLGGTTPGHLIFAMAMMDRDVEETQRQVQSFNTRLEVMSEDEFQQELRVLGEWYRDMLPILRLPRGQQAGALESVEAKTKRTFILAQLNVVLPTYIEAFRRAETFSRGTDCLIALKRWRLSHSDPPPDLAAVVAAAGLPEIPIDPYSDQPFRFAIVKGEPVIYSIGPDGVDDRGEFDFLVNSAAEIGSTIPPGDVLFRLR